MFFHSVNGRVLGLLAVAALSFPCSRLDAADASVRTKPAEVAIKYKSAGLADFRLADYGTELLKCSALAAMHTWIGDNIGQDAGSEIRRAIGEDYWLEISKEYLALATEADGKSDLSAEFSTQIKGLTVEWRRLNETHVTAGDWDGWYDLVDRCEAWRPKNTIRSFHGNGRKSVAAQGQAPKVVGG